MSARTGVGVVVVMGIVLAACGSGGGADSATEAPANDPGAGGSAAPPVGGEPSSAGEPGSVDSGDAWGSAIIIFDGASTDYTVGQFGCSTHPDRKQAQAHGDASDGSDATFSATLPMIFEDWDNRDADRMIIIADGHFWAANGPRGEDPATFEGDRVDSLEVSAVSDDPRSFHATGTFFMTELDELGAEVDPGNLVAGSFDVTCDPTS